MGLKNLGENCKSKGHYFPLLPMQLGFMMTTVDEGTVFNLVVLISRQLARKTVGVNCDVLSN